MIRKSESDNREAKRQGIIYFSDHDKIWGQPLTKDLRCAAASRDVRTVRSKNAMAFTRIAKARSPQTEHDSHAGTNRELMVYGARFGGIPYASFRWMSETKYDPKEDHILLQKMRQAVATVS